MGDMNLKIEDTQFSQAISKAILEQLTSEARDAIITQAITAMNKPETRGYGYAPKTPLQAAFEEAINVAVRTMVYDIVRDQPESPIAIHINTKISEWMSFIGDDLDPSDVDTVIAQSLVSFYRNKSNLD